MVLRPASGPDLWDNPMGTDGFEFIEYTAPTAETLSQVFLRMGFVAVARHRSKRVTLFRQGDINFILNAEPRSPAEDFAQAHGPSANAVAFRVRDAGRAYARALALGAKPFVGRIGPMELNIPAIEGIGGAALYLVDRYGPKGSIYDVDFVPIPGVDPHPPGAGLTTLDHVTHNVAQGRMRTWSDFYARLFNFRELRYFDIAGKHTGLHSQAMTSPCGKIRIPINESADDRSQIVEFLRAYRGEGIQHVALGAADIHAAVETLRARGVRFLDTPDTYYEAIDERVPGHGEDFERLKRNRILMDGGGAAGLLLQIFTENLIGPIFFEVIERRGNDGFGEGNFKALFEAMEQDQLRRGELKA